MKVVLFCQNPYAFGILGPLCHELANGKNDILWYIPDTILDKYPYGKNYPISSSIEEIYNFRSDAIFVPGNEVPHYIRGVKAQIFHGFAGEKKGHFRIRHYFDVYLTQGPYFTKKFKLLANRFENFDVIETGWSKLDPYYSLPDKEFKMRDAILERTGMKHLVLYAPTFSPSFTSATIAHDHILELSRKENIHVLVKFHDLTAESIIQKYTDSASRAENLEIIPEENIIPMLRISDLMISDTSSVVYEFLLLDKPVITINSASSHINWKNITDPSILEKVVIDNLESDKYAEGRKWIRENYHPYTDGRSSLRMIEAVHNYIKINGIPDERKLSWLRKHKMNRMFGKPKYHV